MKELFEKFIEIIDLKSIETTGIKVIIAMAIVLLALWFSRKLQHYIEQHLKHDDFEDERAVRKYKITANIVIMTLGACPRIGAVARECHFESDFSCI